MFLNNASMSLLNGIKKIYEYIYLGIYSDLAMGWAWDTFFLQTAVQCNAMLVIVEKDFR